MKLYAKINSGAAGIIWVVGFFVLLGLVALSKAIAAQYPIAVVGWTGGLVTILLKKNADNKLDLEAAKSGSSTVDNLDAVKVNAQ